MPYIKIQTNVAVEDRLGLLKKLSEVASREIGKPEQYVMTALSPAEEMTFGGTSDPCVFMECKSIGLGTGITAGLSSALCGFCGSELGVDESRVYIEFSGAEGAMWGWNGRTF